MRYFEDFKVGDQFEFGSKTMTKQEIIAFAEQFDPQSFHLSEEQAKDSIFGGLVASGWHLCGVFMRMHVDNFLSQTAGLGSPGVDNIRWLQPVRPGDVLRARTEVLELRPSASRPTMGVVKLKTELLNQRDQVVMTMQGTGFVARRSEQGETKKAPSA
jgi:acyl dehydratase